MTSRKQRLRIAPTFLLALTVPVLAMLCRGHSPSRYDLPNLPVWERQAPPAAKVHAYSAQTALPSGSAQVTSSTLDASLRAADDSLFTVLDSAAGAAVDRRQAGAPGEWLELTTQLSRYEPGLLPRVNQITMRLLSRQTADGYLGPPKAVHHYSSDDIAAHSQNIIGLLGGYAITKNPAVLYGAISAGHFVLQNYDPPKRTAATRSDSTIVYALTQLYLLTSDGDFLAFAQREGEKSQLSGVALCSLYEATGDSGYLRRARDTWSLGDHGPRFATKMFVLTGDPAYFVGASHSTLTPAWRSASAFTLCNGALRINDLQPAEIHWKDMTISVAHKDSRITCTVLRAASSARTIQLLLPPCPLPSGQHRAKSAAPGYWTGRRVWKAGDRIVLAAGSACGPPVVSSEKAPGHASGRTL